MDQESNQMEQHPVLCRNGCGFYSNAGTEGFCSVCYKDLIKKKQQPPTNMPASLAPMPSSAGGSTTMASLSIDESSSSSTSPNNASAASVETGTPTVIVPGQTDPRTESSESEPLGAAAAAAAASTSSAASATAAPTEAALPSPAVDGASQDAEHPKDGKKKKNRCLACKKKVGLTGFTCRCGGLFCSLHRYSDKHDCSFNYKELGQEEIRKSNPVVVAKKVQQI